MNDIKQTPLNFELTEPELVEQCRAIMGGVSWPAKKPGFAVVVGMMKETHFDSHDIYLLEEFESYDTAEIIKACTGMDERYKPTAWYGDDRNEAADKLITEMIAGLQLSLHDRCFWVCRTVIVEIQALYPYILPKIKRLLDPQRRMLFLKESKIINYLSAIEEADIADLRLGEYPAIEALAFAVIECQRSYPAEKPKQIKDRVGYAVKHKRPESPMVMG